MEIVKTSNGELRFKEKVYLPSGKTKTKTFKRKTDCANWKKFATAEITKNKVLGIAPLKENLKFADLFEIWMIQKIVSIRSFKTVADYRGIFRKHFKVQIGELKIQTIERRHADLMVNNLQRLCLSPKTVNKVVSVFKQVLLFAENEGYLFKSPLRNFAKIKVSAGRIDFLSQQEILQLLRGNVGQDIYPILVVALNTGLRIGELTGLCFDRINFESDFIEISRNLTRKGLSNVTKTHLVRYIPMNDEVKTVLLDQVKNQRSPKFVFTKQNGEPYNPDHFSERYLTPALERAGIRKVTMHVFRHTFASQFMMNGGSPYDLQKILGHTKFEMTQKYAHLSPQHLRKAVDVVRFSASGNLSVSPYSALAEKDAKRISIVSS